MQASTPGPTYQKAICALLLLGGLVIFFLGLYQDFSIIGYSGRFLGISGLLGSFHVVRAVLVYKSKMAEGVDELAQSDE